MIIRRLFSSSVLTIYHQRISNPSISRRCLPLVPRLPLRHASHSNGNTVDEKIEQIQELYATARDEFEIASEETLKKTVYAADDRAAATDELLKLKAAFDRAVAEAGGEEIRSRIGGRIRELERAVEAMEEMAKED